MYASIAELKAAEPVFAGTSYADKTLVRYLQNAARRIDGVLARDYALPVSVASAGVLTFTGNVSADETVKAGTKTYTFKAIPADANDVDLGATSAQSVINLKRAINESTNGGSYDGDTTINVDVIASSSALVLSLTARVPGPDGNDLTLSTSATNITVTTAFAGGARFFEILEQLNIWVATVSLLAGQSNSTLSGGNVSVTSDIREDIKETIALLPISGSLVDTDGTTRAPESNAPVTNADTYPIADMSDPLNWDHDADRDFDRNET